LLWLMAWCVVKECRIELKAQQPASTFVRRAKQAFTWLKESKAMKLNTMHYGALIDGYAKCGDDQEVLK